MVSTIRAFARTSAGWSSPRSAKTLLLPGVTDSSFVLGIVFLVVFPSGPEALLDQIQFALRRTDAQRGLLLKCVQHVDDFADLDGARRAIRAIARIVVHGDLDYVAQVAFHRLGIRVWLAALNLAQHIAGHKLYFRRKRGEIVSRRSDEL